MREHHKHASWWLLTDPYFLFLHLDAPYTLLGESFEVWPGLALWAIFLDHIPGNE